MDKQPQRNDVYPLKNPSNACLSNLDNGLWSQAFCYEPTKYVEVCG